MKKLGWLFLFMVIAGFLLMRLTNHESFADNPKVDAKAAFLMDAQTGDVYYKYNADHALPPASMSKMMTELIILEDIRDGKTKWNDPVSISSYAANVTGAQVGLKAKEKLSIRELFEAMVVHSANDAAVALAEHVSGTESKFVARMNRTAQTVGLSSKTKFANATGLSSEDLQGIKSAASGGDTVMTARDIAKLAAYLIGKHPDILDISQMSKVNFSRKSITLQTTNLMLPGNLFAYSGNDGLKTGFTDEAGYCFTGTALRDGKRLISVVMGARDSESRFIETKKLFTYGFAK
ncbi:D-alanyl-D-alanine carboxypeptidase family protein [Paenibacillus sedimenti]|uniref:D-alanyl-D-alanine carboxypeptidase n=1 Tax=Paenibacillus sedimenti TaxID=2770274 RepID=A0A926KLA4_9BACL|nr:D-alanyl-D-alanine carboxypeptidase family protein [Paenibacillus sedimenti]MBD0379218.1 D-alanyl-D-alanine carboxypeptidase [Paenibacillus sedimenti]